MNDKSDKSDNNSVETKISAHTFYQNSGDGPQVSYPYNDTNQMSLHELSSVDKNIMFHNIDLSNTTDSNCGSTVISGNRKNFVKSAQGTDKMFSGDQKEDRSDIREIFKNIQYSMNQLKVTNSSIKNQISKNSEEIGSYLLDRDYGLQIQLKTDIANIVNASDLQRLQMSLLYILEQMTHLSSTISNTQLHLEKLNGQKRVDGTESREKICQDEDDIFSVEELSWDENHLRQERKCMTTNEKCAVPNFTSLDKQVQVRISQSTIVANNPTFKRSGSDEMNNNEISNDDSTKGQHSKSLTQQSNNNDFPQSSHDKIELTNSFNDLKKRFENFNYTNVTTQSQKKDNSVTSNRDDKKIKSKDSVEVSRKSKASILENECLQNKLLESIDDCVDNSAFLVSSIDSFTNSISCTNPDNNNNKFSDRFKTIESNLNEKSKLPSSIAIDLMAEIVPYKNPSSKSNSKKIDSSHYGKPFEGANKSMEHYIEVEHGDIIPTPEFIQSPYINYQQKNDNDTKSSTSSSEKIVAFGKLYERLKKSVKEDQVKHEEFAPIYHYMKEMIDSEKVYINGLFILSQVLYTRIKATDIISHRNFNQLFPDCIHQLFKVHSSFSEQLDDVLQLFPMTEAQKNTQGQDTGDRKCQTIKFGQIFLVNLEKDNWNMFVQYRQYFARYKVALSTFNRLKSQSPKFDRLIKNLQHNEHCKGLDLAAYMALPIQRLSMYLTLIRKISDNLPKNQTEEKVSVLAVEHLLHCFLNEMGSRQDSSGKDGTRIEYSTSRSSNISMKGTSLNEIVLSEPKDNSESKCDSLSREFNSKNVKKLDTQIMSLNNFKHDAKLKVHSKDVNSESLLHDNKISSENHSPSKLLGHFHSTQSLDNINKLSETSSISRKLESPDKSNNKDSNLIYKQRGFLSSHNKIKKLFASQINNLRQSHGHSRVDGRKSLSLSTLKEFDSESLQSQVTDECSVCLNSQDEFEVDTSLEDDDKTCIGAPILKTDRNDQCRSNAAISSLSQNSAKYPLIEFCSEADSACHTFLLPPTNNGHRHSLKNLSQDYSQEALLTNVLSSEAEIMVYKKVDKMVQLLCQVVVEILFNDQEQSWSIPTEDLTLHRCSALTNLLNKHYSAWPDSPNEKCTKNSIEFSGDIKNSNKKFSLRHLFSLKRRGHVDQNMSVGLPIKACESSTQIRSFSRISLQKKHSLIPKVSNK